MTVNELITLFAIILGPILAVQVEKYLSRRREILGRRERVFKSLMLTRYMSISPEHVSALNQISLEFPTRKYPKTTAAWRDYFAHLNKSTSEAGWDEKRQDLLSELLSRMAKELSFNQEFLEIKRDFYLPQAHVNIDNENARMREYVIELLEGKRKITVVTEKPREFGT